MRLLSQRLFICMHNVFCLKLYVVLHKTMLQGRRTRFFIFAENRVISPICQEPFAPGRKSISCNLAVHRAYGTIDSHTRAVNYKRKHQLHPA